MWASDITQDEGSETWADVLSFVRDNVALACGDKGWVLGGAARRHYQWEATSASAQRDDSGA